MTNSKKIKMGMLGGGPGAFIGDVHRKAAALDGYIELVCGCFSSDPAKSRITGEESHLPAHRVYASFQEMIEKESRLPEDERMDFLAVVTPNHLHFEPAMMALEHGFHVVCDKPMTISSDEAEQLVKAVQSSGLLFCLTHNYTGYPMVKEAQARIAAGELGPIRKIVAEYPQGWLSEKLEDTDNKQAGWRADPEKAGAGGALGDIGTHAFNLSEYMSGLKIKELFADITSFVPGRVLDDDCNLLVRFENQVKGVLYASQISAGEENGLYIRIYGEKASLSWRQTDPNTLTMQFQDKPAQIIRSGAGNAYLSEAARNRLRLPAGHPEGFIEAFANIYKDFALEFLARRNNEKAPEWIDYPTVYDGLRGVRFIEAAVSSSSSGKWIKLT